MTGSDNGYGVLLTRGRVSAFEPATALGSAAALHYGAQNGAADAVQTLLRNGRAPADPIAGPPLPPVRNADYSLYLFLLISSSHFLFSQVPYYLKLSNPTTFISHSTPISLIALSTTYRLIFFSLISFPPFLQSTAKHLFSNVVPLIFLFLLTPPRWSSPHSLFRRTPGGRSEPQRCGPQWAHAPGQGAMEVPAGNGQSDATPMISSDGGFFCQGSKAALRSTVRVNRLA